MTKSKLFILSLCLFAALCLQAQEKMPQAISYQAVARDAQGKVIAAQTIGVKVEILKGSASGEVIFSETHNPTSSRTGTVNLLIGQGSPVTGEFAAIDWGGDTYYLQLNMDVAGGSNYQLVSTTQMFPVPYALYAAKAGSAEQNSSSVIDFALIPDDGYSEYHEILAGESDSFFLDAYILYLNGEDQNVECTIESDLPENFPWEIRLSPSSNNGRHIIIGYDYKNLENYEIPKGTYNVKYIFTNKYGKKREFAFKYIID